MQVRCKVCGYVNNINHSGNIRCKQCGNLVRKKVERKSGKDGHNNK